MFSEHHILKLLNNFCSNNKSEFHLYLWSLPTISNVHKDSLATYRTSRTLLPHRSLMPLMETHYVNMLYIMASLKEACLNCKTLIRKGVTGFIILHNRKTTGTASLKTAWLSNRVCFNFRQGPQWFQASSCRRKRPSRLQAASQERSLSQRPTADVPPIYIKFTSVLGSLLEREIGFHLH